MSRLLIPVLALLPAIGCATSSKSTSWKPPPGQRCTDYDLSPLRLPSEILDTSAVYQHIGQRGTGTLLLSVYRETSGTLRWVKVIQSSLAPKDQEDIETEVRRALRPTDRSEAFRLYIRTGADPVLETRPSEKCMPLLRNEKAMSRQLRAASQEMGHVGRTMVQVFINSKGVVKNSRIRESSGSAEFDRMASQLVREMVFHPAVLDGTPISVWVDMPVSIDTQRR